MVRDDILKVLVTEEQIEKRCAELAAQIEEDYNKEGEVPIVVGLLKGSVPFMAELIKYFNFECEIDFMNVSSYKGTKSSGAVRIDWDMESPAKDRSILLVEDIVDTGRTLVEVKKMLENKETKVKIVTLLNKPKRREFRIDADYIGFEVPNEFVVGYGLDYNQKYRNMPFVGVLKPEIYK